MRTAAPALLPLFRSPSQVEMLALLVLQPEREWTLGELAEVVNAPPSSVHRELRRAADAGLVVRDDRQRPHRFRAARESPAFEPLRQLLDVTVGFERRLRDALAPVEGIKAAAIHGSWARGRVRPDSDIDVLVLTDGDPRQAARVARRTGREIGRDVDASVLAPADFARLRRERNPFADLVVRGPRIDVIGDLDSADAAA